MSTLGIPKPMFLILHSPNDTLTQLFSQLFNYKILYINYSHIFICAIFSGTAPRSDICIASSETWKATLSFKETDDDDGNHQHQNLYIR